MTVQSPIFAAHSQLQICLHVTCLHSPQSQQRGHCRWWSPRPETTETSCSCCDRSHNTGTRLASRQHARAARTGPAHTQVIKRRDNMTHVHSGDGGGVGFGCGISVVKMTIRAPCAAMLWIYSSDRMRLFVRVLLFPHQPVAEHGERRDDESCSGWQVICGFSDGGFDTCTQKKTDNVTHRRYIANTVWETDSGLFNILFAAVVLWVVFIFFEPLSVSEPPSAAAKNRSSCNTGAAAQ